MIYRSKLLIDTREKWTQGADRWRMIDYFSAHCYMWVVRKLDVGDYMFDGGRITVDRKKDLDELSKNLTNRADFARFMDEVRKARAERLKLIVLCEHGRDVKGIPDVAKWQSEFSHVSGRALMDRIYKVHISYGVEFLFCDKRETARRILEILGDEKIENSKNRY